MTPLATATIRPIALLTDFGLDDPYVGQMKGVLAARAPGAPLIDISHAVQPYRIVQGAFFLAASAPHYPGNTVFLCVVDPGVGSSRRVLVARSGGRTFVGPDNGLFSLALGEDQEAVFYDATETAAEYAASATFHGRDVFAPLAARLAKGEAPESLGTPLPAEDIVRHEWTRPRSLGHNLLGHVLHIDRFGNCVLNLRAEKPRDCSGVRLVSSPVSSVEAGLRFVERYDELQGYEVGLLAGSQGYLELAVRQGSAAQVVGLLVGDPVTLTMGAQ